MALPTSQGARLAAKIVEATAIVEEYRQTHGLLPLSLGPEATVDSYPSEVEKHRQRLIEATQELNQLAMGPGDLCNLPGYTCIQKIATARFITEFDITQKVLLSGDISYEVLSELVGVKSGVLKQILRATMTFHNFHEPRAGYVAHTATAKLWAQDQLVRDWLSQALQEWVDGLMNLGNAMRSHPEADDPANSPFMLGYGNGEAGMYQFFNKKPEKARRFASVMSAFQEHDGYAVRHLTDNFAWGKLGTGTVVDLGGSSGAVGFALVEKFASLKVVVQDLAGTIETAQTQPGKNVSFMTHDFLVEQPVKGADV